MGSERWFIQDHYKVSRKAVLEEVTSSGYKCILWKIHQDVYLEFMHFSVSIRYANKKLLIKTNRPFWLKVYALFPLLCCLQGSKWWMAPRNFLHRSQPAVARNSAALNNQTWLCKTWIFPRKDTLRGMQFPKTEDVYVHMKGILRWCSENALSLLQSCS